MTELKHGSNVAGLQTEAILDVHTDEWIVNVRDLGWLACVLYVYGTPGKLQRLKAALFHDEGVKMNDTPPHMHTHTPFFFAAVGLCWLTVAPCCCTPDGRHQTTAPSSGGSATLQKTAGWPPCLLASRCMRFRVLACLTGRIWVCAFLPPLLLTPSFLLLHCSQVPAPDGSGALDDHGVHAFIVPLRDDAGGLWPGVEIHDCGYKVGPRACGAVCVCLQQDWPGGGARRGGSFCVC